MTIFFNLMFSSFIPTAVAKAATITVAAAVPVATAAPVVSELQQRLDEVKPVKVTSGAETETAKEPKQQELTEDAKTHRWVCNSCNPNEKKALAFFQSQGITDRNALATIMGNIKQESNFHSNICEGGARISYGSCRWGGYGLIQWTSIDRYKGLGSHSWAKGMNPSTIDAQLSWLVQERQWKGIQNRMKTPGLSIGSYMNTTYSWIGWGIHGARTHFAHDYANRLSVNN
jgi:hypothetical protein